MKTVNMKKGDVTQFYVVPTIIVSRSRIGKRVFIAFLYWSIEL